MNNLHRGIAPYLLRRYAEGGDVDVEEGKSRARSMMENFMRPSKASPMELLQSYGNELFGEGLGAGMGAVADVATLPPKLLAYPFLPEKLQEDIKFFPTMEEGAKAGRKIYEDVTGELPELDPRDQTMVGIAAMLTPTPGGKAKGIETIVEESPLAKIGNKNPDTGFYSGLETAARDLPQQKGSGQQMLAMIQKQGGVKPEEIEWTGLGDFLKGKESVTKDEIADYLLNNRVELQEVRLGEVPGSTGPTRYHEGAVSNIHTELPGGTNYREVLLTMPAKRPNFEQWVKDTYNMDYHSMNGMQQLNARSGYDKIVRDGVVENEYRSSHYIDQPNILAHVRLNDRVDADGKKVLFIEEIQSDWHQTGRKKGYRGKTAETITEDQWYNARDKAKDALKNEGLLGFDSAGEALSVIRRYDDYASRWDIRNPESIAALDEYLLITDRYLAESSAVPDAPFKTSWHELALRRVLQEAAEGGYDRIAFTKGGMQADRYDLSKQVEKIDVPWIREDKRSVRIQGVDGAGFNLQVSNDGVVSGNLPSAEQFRGKKLDEVVGKEMAEKIMGLDSPEVFTGVDLKVGGEGMKGFYDQILPKSLNKLGKKFDAKVGTTRIGVDPAGLGDARYHVEHPTNPAKSSTFFDEQAARKFAEEVGGTVQIEDKTREVWSMDITPKMRETVQQTGLPLFAKGGEVDAPDLMRGIAPYLMNRY